MQSQNQILMLLFNHFTNDTRVLKEARSLVNAGYEVEIRCYHDVDFPKYEIIDGISIERILFVSRAKRKNILVKFLLLFQYFLAYQKNIKRFNFIHCHDLIALPFGVFAKLRNKKAKIIYDCHEYETEVVRPQRWLKIFSIITEKLFIRYVDRVIAVSEGIADEYVRKYKIEKPILVLNCPPYQAVDKNNVFRQKFGISEDSIIFLYQGGLFRNRGVENIYEAFIQNKDAKKVCVFMGYGPLEKKLKEVAEKNENIFFHEAVPPDTLLNYTASADIGMCLIENACLSYYYCLPNKLFEYNMAGLPVIVSDLFELSKFAKQYQTGIILKENAVNGFLDVIQKINISMLDELRNNIPTVTRLYNWENQEKNLLQLYASLQETQ